MKNESVLWQSTPSEVIIDDHHNVSFDNGVTTHLLGHDVPVTLPILHLAISGYLFRWNEVEARCNTWSISAVGSPLGAELVSESADG
jgi:hypothetical protein